LWWRIKQGRPSAERGKVTEAFLCAVEDVCRDQGIEAGEISRVPKGRLISLWFSKGLPRGFCQRLRKLVGDLGLGGAAESGVRWSWSSRRFHDADPPPRALPSIIVRWNDLTVFPPVRAAAPLSGWKNPT